MGDIELFVAEARLGAEKKRRNFGRSAIVRIKPLRVLGHLYIDRSEVGDGRRSERKGQGDRGVSGQD